MTLNGKIALVTGGARGIGYAISEKLLNDGAKVVIADIDAELAESSREVLSTIGPATMAMAMNVADEKSVKDGIQQIANELGPIQILINNAGVYKSTPLHLDNAFSNWQLCLDVMLNGSFLVAKEVAPLMINEGWGRIINLGSLMSHNAFGEDAAYCAAKTGMLGLTRSLSADLARHNICVNTICPGNILTAMLRNTAKAIEKRDGLEPDSWLRDQGQRIPMRRLGQPEDIANVVSFFCSNLADYVTGQTLHVNGGQYYQ